ncbi:DUF5105 domain-containing protein [Clostridium bornimense]|uniref:DUF5105 domain-containing protein n=1 Tax=Clostridium bornimense TaxID=1216932 RepID=UPI001C101569|nr:DUF5105 domain-containing protein [Clostridium bornimense]MBU5316207.1 DUF5105 domain-containing protein [Clostridium bornimense]
MKQIVKFCYKLITIFLIGFVLLFVYYIADDLLGNKTNEVISPAESAKIVSQFYLYGDKSGVKELGMSDEEIQAALRKGKEESIKVMKNNINALGYSVGNDKLEQYYNAIMKASKKLTVKTKLVSQDKNIAIVSIKANNIPFTEISYKASSKVEEALGTVEGEEADYIEMESKIYMDSFIEELESVEPSSDFYQEEVAFTRAGNGWFPANNDMFATTIDNLITK